MNMTNMASMANNATALPGKGGAPSMSFGTGTRHSENAPGVKKGMSAIGEEATDCDNWVEPRAAPQKDNSADLNNKLDLLMRQLEDVKKNTSQQTSEMQQKLDQQQKLYEQQQQMMMMNAQMMQQPQMMMQQPQPMMVQQPQQWDVQAQAQATPQQARP